MSNTQNVIRAMNCPQISPQDQKGADISAKVKIKADHKRKDGTHAIYLQCYVRGEQIRIPTQISVPLKAFSLIKERVKPSYPRANDYNLIIEEMLRRVHEMRVKARLGEFHLSRETFKEAITNASLSVDFLVYMKWKIEQRKNELAYTTLRHHRSVAGILAGWRPQIFFSAINDALFFEFRKHLMSKGNKLNTVGHKLKIIKTYLNYAAEDGFQFEFPQKATRALAEKGRAEGLSFPALNRLHDLYRSLYLAPSDQQTLRCFLFACYTGLRYADIKALRPDNITENHLIVRPLKTKMHGKLIKIPLTQKAKSLLDKEGDTPLGTVISNQKMNSNLKKIRAYAGLRQRLTFHVARHTFATVFLELGGSLEVLQQLLGHSTIKLTMVYAHVADKRKEEQMACFDQI